MVLRAVESVDVDEKQCDGRQHLGRRGRLSESDQGNPFPGCRTYRCRRNARCKSTSCYPTRPESAGTVQVAAGFDAADKACQARCGPRSRSYGGCSPRRRDHREWRGSARSARRALLSRHDPRRPDDAGFHGHDACERGGGPPALTQAGPQRVREPFGHVARPAGEDVKASLSVVFSFSRWGSADRDPLARPRPSLPFLADVRCFGHDVSAGSVARYGLGLSSG
jgi:hypothetical protein